MKNIPWDWRNITYFIFTNHFTNQLASIVIANKKTYSFQIVSRRRMEELFTHVIIETFAHFGLDVRTLLFNKN